MRLTYYLFLLAFVSLYFQACSNRQDTPEDKALTTATAGERPLPEWVVEELNSNTLGDTVVRSEDEWRQLLTPAEYHVLREEGTEPPFKNEYNSNKKRGIYACAGCGNPMFSSETKFESGTGWPSFYAPVAEQRVKEDQDLTLGMVRTEVECARCGSHIGHVFPDGPEPTGLRYCLNSLALEFRER